MSAGGSRAPSVFRLKGPGVELSYAVDRAGQRLIYRGPGGEFEFGGDEIEKLETPIGSLLTAQLRAKPDAETLDLTLLLPTINLPRAQAPGLEPAGGATGGAAVEFSAVAILTTTRTSIGGPGLISGPLQRYRVLELRGTAAEAVG